VNQRNETERGIRKSYRRTLGCFVVAAVVGLAILVGLIGGFVYLFMHYSWR
jgi:hypothetical protein